ncbi:MAG: hypothetical protein IPM51_07420 [Sphingobacteriaceae bacterium]|nr:hypothetical protein [Sphingobacteriaceae bacterium]
MKKSLLALTLTAALFSCKKDIEQKSLEATDITGMGWVKGTLRKTIITPDGGAGWTSNTKVPAAGVNVSVRVNKNGGTGIYPNSNQSGVEVFNGVTDANGNYAIAVKSNGTSNGVNALVLVEGFQGTQDTLINGVTKTGRLCNYFGMSQNMMVYKGQSTYWNGNNNINEWAFYNGNMSVVNDNNNPTQNQIGTAQITGSVTFGVWTSSTNVVSGTVQPSSVNQNGLLTAPAGTKVYYTFNTDPLSLSTKVYETSLAANGTYTFDVSTVKVNTPGFGQDGNVWIQDLRQSRDTIKITSVYTGTTFVSSSTVIATGPTGVYNGGTFSNQNDLFNGEIRNGVNHNYNFFSFTQD